MEDNYCKDKIGYSGIDNLPNELIYKILCMKSIDLVQLINLSYTCKRLNQLCSGFNNELWRLKFLCRWPNLFERIYANNLCSTYGCWKDELRSRYLYGKEVHTILRKISHDQYFDGEMSFKSFESFENSNRRLGHPNGIHFQIDELNLILTEGNEEDNLTIKYYARKVLRYLRHTVLKPAWTNYFIEIEGGIEPPRAPRLPLATTADIPNLPLHRPDDDFYESTQRGNKWEDKDYPGNYLHGALLFSQWCQPMKFIEEKDILSEINHLAELVVDQLKIVNPKNAFFQLRSGLLLSDEEAVKLKNSLFSRKDCKMILECINYYLYGTWRDFKSSEDEPLYIEEVLRLKGGNHFTLCIIHQTIASKLGVKLMILDYPRKPILCWRDFENQPLYIDVSLDGKICSEDHSSIQEIVNQDYDEIFYSKLYRPGRVFRSLSWFVIEEGRAEGSSMDLVSQRNGLELLRLISPNDSEPKLLLSRIYIHLNINLEEVDTMLREINSTDPTSSSLVMFLYQSAQSQIKATFKIPSRPKPVRKRRVKKQKVKYAIGMIMKHEKYNYNCVIYAWDPICAASKDWATQMRVNSLRLKGNQPFYNVLVEDGSTRYAAQENLSMLEYPCEIPHSEIGKYFERFRGPFYLPNEEKSFEYPDDEAVRNELVRNFYGSYMYLDYTCV